MKYLFILSLVCLSSHALSSCLNPLEQQNYLKLKEAVALPSPWVEFNPKEIPVALYGSDPRKLTLMNVSAEQLNQASIPYEVCSDFPELLSIDANPAFAGISNTLYEFIYSFDTKHEPLGEFARSTQSFILLFSIGPCPFVPAPLDANLARTLIHEMFHMAYQYVGKFTMPQSEIPDPHFYNQCSKNLEWLSVHQQEKKLVIKIRKEWDGLSDLELKEIVKELSVIRKNYPQGQSKIECTDPEVFWERFEGTAHYIDMVVGLGINAFTTYPAEDWNDGSEKQFYYLSGGTYSMLLKRLYSSQEWQKRINTSEDPFSVLEEYVLQDTFKTLSVNK